MTNDNFIADGIPMSLEQMREYLQDYYGIPIAMRKQGTTVVASPFCNTVRNIVSFHHCASWEPPSPILDKRSSQKGQEA